MFFCVSASSSKNCSLKAYVKSSDDVVEMIKQEIATISTTLAADAQASCSSSSSDEITILSPQNRQKRKRKAVFDCLEDELIRPSTSSPAADPNRELDEYLCLPRENISLSPLHYWKMNESRFPHLAKLAARHLSLPATSGSVERLFSIAGYIQRADRSSLKTSKIEKMLICRESLLNRAVFPNKS